jgi:hypothetical protein
MRFYYNIAMKEYFQLKERYSELYYLYYYNNSISDTDVFSLKKFHLVNEFLINELKDPKHTLPELFLRILLNKWKLPKNFTKARKELGLYEAWKNWYPEMKEN